LETWYSTSIEIQEAIVSTKRTNCQESKTASKSCFPDVLSRTRGIPNLADIGLVSIHLPAKQNIGISSEFVGNNEPEDIVTCLKLYNLNAYLEMFGNKEVLVTDDGINPDGIWPSVMK